MGMLLRLEMYHLLELTAEGLSLLGQSVLLLNQLPVLHIHQEEIYQH